MPIALGDVNSYQDRALLCFGKGFESKPAGMHLCRAEHSLASGGSSTLPKIALVDWMTRIVVVADNDEAGLAAALDPVTT